MLGVGLTRTGVLAEQVTELVATFVVILMPAIVALPLMVGFWDVRTFPRIWGYVLALPWLALGAWLLSRHDTRQVAGAAA